MKRKLYYLVHQIMVNNYQARNSDKRLMWIVWSELRYASAYSLNMDSFMNEDCPTPESITRCRRKIQERYPDLQSSSRVHIARSDKAAQKGTHIYRENAKRKAEICPNDKNVLRMKFDTRAGATENELIIEHKYLKCPVCAYRIDIF